MIPEITTSTKEEREQYIKMHFACKSNCEICGICQMYRGKDPLIVYKDYIDGKTDYFEIAKRYR